MNGQFFACFLSPRVEKGKWIETTLQMIDALYQTAEKAMSRRGQTWTEAKKTMWDAVFEMTAPPRKEAVKKGRRAMMK